MKLKDKKRKNIKYSELDLDGIDKRTQDYKIAKQALKDKDITGLDRRSIAYKIWSALHDKKYGDAVGHFTEFLGIEKCDKCKDRQIRWNKKMKAEMNIDVLVFKEDTILNEDAQLLLQAIWEMHRRRGIVDSELIVPFGELYYSIYRKRPSCTSCGFMRRFDKVIRL